VDKNQPCLSMRSDGVLSSAWVSVQEPPARRARLQAPRPQRPAADAL